MNSRTTSHPTPEELAKAWREGYAAGWKDQECDFPPHTSENPYKEQHMDNVNHPKHYEDGPFECIELTRLLSFDWGNVVKYCYRWQHKNGVEDLKKALWFINDAITHNGRSSPRAANGTPTFSKLRQSGFLASYRPRTGLISNSSGGTSSGETAWTCSKPSPKRSMKSKRKESNHGTHRAVRHQH